MKERIQSFFELLDRLVETNGDLERRVASLEASRDEVTLQIGYNYWFRTPGGFTHTNYTFITKKTDDGLFVDEDGDLYTEMGLHRGHVSADAGPQPRYDLIPIALSP
jgi:hypothetical protein